jgi:glycosyltransferase involved in cell wall biosynthesis
MMNECKVSIITVCFNSEAVIEYTMKSVLHQDYDNLEYIIVDGKSTDSTMQIIEKYKVFFERKGIEFKVISEPDKGIYDAMNKGISMAAGNIIGLINSGDWYEDCAVSTMIDYYNEYQFDMFYADLRIWRKGKPMVKKAKLQNYITTRDWNHPTTFITKETYENFRYACHGIYDDWDLVLRIRRSGRKIVVCNRILANFTFGGISNKKSIKHAWSRFRERYKIYLDNGYSRWYIVECLLMETVKYFAA